MDVKLICHIVGVALTTPGPRQRIYLTILRPSSIYLQLIQYHQCPRQRIYHDTPAKQHLFATNTIPPMQSHVEKGKEEKKKQQWKLVHFGHHLITLM
jgi:hypothetical protein